MRKSQPGLFSPISRFNNLAFAVCDSHGTSSRASITSTIDAFVLANSFDSSVVTTCRIKSSMSGIVDGDTRSFLAWTIDSGIGSVEQKYARIVFVKNSKVCVYLSLNEKINGTTMCWLSSSRRVLVRCCITKEQRMLLPHPTGIVSAKFPWL